MSVTIHKNYLADKKPFYKHFYTRDITITAVRSVAIQGLMVFNGFVASLDIDETDEEETASEDEDDLDKLKKKANKKEKEEFVPPTAEEFTVTCLTSFTKSLSITTCIRVLEEIAIKYLRAQVVSKLIKDLGKSASRKFIRTHSRLSAATLMVKTGMRGNVLGHVSIFLIEEAHQVLLILYRRYRPTTKKTSKKQGQLRKGDDQEKEEAEQESRTFLQITAKNATRSGLAVVTGGIGAAVGTFIRPGFGTVVGATIGDTIAYVI